MEKYTDKITACENGLQALEAIKSVGGIAKNVDEAYNLAIVDYQMPEMDGIELIKVIRKYENGCPNPIVILCIF